MNSVLIQKLNSTVISESSIKHSTNDLSDELLIARFIDGSQASYELLVMRYKKRIFEFIYFQIKQNNHDAEDLTQDVFIELYRKAESFRKESKFSTYLFSIAKNIVLNYFRATSRRFSFSLVFSKERETKVTDLQEQFVNEKDQQQVYSVINSLSPDERQIIYLCDRENFSYTQISEILNIKMGTVRSRLSTTRNKVIKKLRESNHEM